SGSTAAPKGVTLAHGPLIANGFDIGERQHLRASDRLWLAVPLFWSFGSANALAAIMTHGGCVVLQESFEAGEALALIERERCSVYYGMSNMARALLEHGDHPRRRLGAMRTGLTIGPPEDIAMTIAALGAGELCNVYGSTETYGNCAVTDADDPLALRLHSQGLPLPGMTIRAVDLATRRPLPQGEIGELAVGGYVTPGYYRAPELDAEAFDRDGYFLTGDLGTIEPDGRIRFLGRLKEMIKTGGVNVAPLEVEQVLLQHPDIVQAYVVGVPDRSKGEIVAAAVELRGGAATDPAAIVAFCRERLASYKVPARLALRTAAQLPRARRLARSISPASQKNWRRTALRDAGAAMAGDVVRLLGEIFRFTSAVPRTYFNGDLALWPIRRDLGRGLVRMSYQSHPIICCCENSWYGPVADLSA
ncbi:MAG TPA: fatty acid--CoA ligase family protein, partial [Xanthobacteraceae bacterium]